MKYTVIGRLPDQSSFIEYVEGETVSQALQRVGVMRPELRHTDWPIAVMEGWLLGKKAWTRHGGELTEGR